MMRHRYRRLGVLLPLLLLLFQLAPTHSSGIKDADPYSILGVTSDDSDASIRKQYHKQCLRYHPDKQCGSNLKERKLLEEEFKRIQAAYSQIGTAEKRREYEAASSVFGFHHQYGATSNSPYDDILRQFQRHAQNPGGGNHHHSSSSRGPFVRVFSTHPNHRNSLFPQFPSSFGKAVFVETIKLPLATLYKGDETISHSIRNNVWSRLVAAVRGRLVYPLLYTSLLYALPLLRVLGKHLCLAVWASLFVSQLPEPVAVDIPLRAGYKPGTKLTFQQQNDMVQVILVLDHDHCGPFVLKGNDLHTQVIVTPKQAISGCSVPVKRLGTNIDAIDVVVPSGSLDKDMIRIPGEGWPLRKSNGRYGDLIVQIRVRR